MRYILLLFLLHIYLHALDIEKPKVYSSENIKNWLMSEKLDGIRAIWNGKVLLSKNGHTIHAPKTFTQNFPPFKLDGELWTKRNDFENIQSIVLDKTPTLQWNEITYNIFEVPFEKGDFLQRLQKAKDWFNKHPNNVVKFIPQHLCEGETSLNKFLDQMVKKKAEGIIVKNLNLPYIAKRHDNILKVKRFYDAEGKIIGIQRHKNGVLKSLTLKLKNNVIFNLGGGFTKAQRKKIYFEGEIVTFKYYGFTKKGKPKFASFLRIRKSE